MTLERWQDSPADASPVRDTDSWIHVLDPVGVLAGNVCNTEFVPADMRNSQAKVAAAILYGRELDLPPMTSLGSIHVIKGKAGLYAETMRALILREGHELRFAEMTETRCVIMGKRKGDSEWTKVSYTMSEAQRSGDFAKNPNYKSRPVEMLIARATARLARMLFADVIKGLAAVEEIQYLDEPEVVQPVAMQKPADPAVQRPAIGRQPKSAVSPAAPAKPEPKDEEPIEAEIVEEDPQPTERKRAPLPTKRAPQPESEPADAKVEELPEEEPSDSADDYRKALIRKSVMHFNRLGYTERDARLQMIQAIVGRDVESTNDLTADELQGLTRRLERSRNAEALEASLDEKPDSDGALPL